MSCRAGLEESRKGRHNVVCPSSSWPRADGLPVENTAFSVFP